MVERRIMNIENIPPQILLDVFSRLPIRSLCKIRCVCKQWYNLTRDPCLHSMLLARPSTFEEETLILTSCCDYGENDRTELRLMTEHCNRPKTLYHFPRYSDVKHSFEGLLCTVQPELCPIVFVSNPLTGEHLNLPPLAAMPCFTAVTSFGLGFDSSMKKYKVVGVYFREIDFTNKRYSLGAQVYTIGTGSSSSWREVMSQPTVPICNYQNSVYASGARHWLVDYSFRPNAETMVISFDFEREEFKTIPRRDELISASSARSYLFDLVDLRGCLGLVDLSLGRYIQIWKLMDYERNQWVRAYRIHMSGSIRVVGLMGEDEIVLLKTCIKDVFDEEAMDVAMLAYNSKTTTWRNIYTFADIDGVFIHRGSLVSLSS